MFDYITKGGSIVWVILGCSFVAAFSFFEKLWQIHAARINTEKFLFEVESLVRQNRVREAEAFCAKIQVPVSKVVMAGISSLNTSREQAQNRMEEVALVELPRLEGHMGILATVATIAPLLGLLGTVTGMIQAFQVIQTKSSAASMVNPGDLAGGIWEALITTVFGLSVAIPTIIGHNCLNHYIKVIQHDMERAASRVLSWI